MAAPVTELSDLEELAGIGGRALDGADPHEILRWADTHFGDSLAIASSMADAVLGHMAATSAPNAVVVFLDTGYHFAETIGTLRAVTATLPLEVRVTRPERTVTGQDADYGPRLYERDPDLCCALRKVEPLSRALAPFRAWASGVRRDEGPSRAETRSIAWDAKRAMVKVNPLAYWTHDQVEEYVAVNGVLVNPLVADGYPSIGCAPCTTRVAAGADQRSGRWAGTGKAECGLHL